ncbi:zinc ribbon domain-containing protein [Ralstonia pickettii]|uniref:zinc ribbon domain-containing protein n=1 Tax=Ralstonia pickettii TaxID=329 RepID=UPI0009B7E8AC|nr:zinc ribbon domain-containing protein [Ralstonia pickettii]
MGLIQRLLGGQHGGGYRIEGGHHGGHHGTGHGAYQQVPPSQSGVICPGCGTASSHSARFCAQCGKALSGVVCGQCGGTVQPGAKFCAQCGNSP